MDSLIIVTQGRLGVTVNMLYTVYVVAKLPNSGTTKVKGHRELSLHGVLTSFAEGEWPGRCICTAMEQVLVGAAHL
jgi:hypothetical protein